MLLAPWLWSCRMTETAGEVAGTVSATDNGIAADGVEAIEELLQRLVRSVATGHIGMLLRQVVVVVVVVVAVGNRLRLLRIVGVLLLDAVARSRYVARVHVIGIVVFGHGEGFNCASSTFAHFLLFTSLVTL